MHGSSKVFWNSIGSLEHLVPPCSFLFQLFCCRLATVFGVIVLHILIRTTLYLEPRSCGCKTIPNHQPSTTVPDSWYEVFVLICLFLPNFSEHYSFLWSRGELAGTSTSGKIGKTVFPLWIIFLIVEWQTLIVSQRSLLMSFLLGIVLTHTGMLQTSEVTKRLHLKRCI